MCNIQPPGKGLGCLIPTRADTPVPVTVSGCHLGLALVLANVVQTSAFPCSKPMPNSRDSLEARNRPVLSFVRFWFRFEDLTCLAAQSIAYAGTIFVSLTTRGRHVQVYPEP